MYRPEIHAQGLMSVFGQRQASGLVSFPPTKVFPRHRSHRFHSTLGVCGHLKNAFYLHDPAESCRATGGYTGAPESTACSTTAMTIAHPRVRGPGQAWGYPSPPR